jgi:hypothetical protein
MRGFLFILLLAALSMASAAPPEGLSKSDWNSIRKEYQRHRQAAFAVDGGWRARNYSQDFSTFFDGQGFEVTPKHGSWRWGLRLAAYGYEGQMRRVSKSKSAADVEKVSYEWDANLREWWINGEAVEHGYTLTSPPGKGHGLRFVLNILGTLRPRVASDCTGVDFAGGDGVTVLNYSGLRVIDATGRQLTAKFTAAPGALHLDIDDTQARYPLTVDPIIQQQRLVPSNAGPSDNFGAAVAISGDTIVVGAPFEDSSSTGVNSTPDEAATDAGAAYVFVKRPGSLFWDQQAYLKPATVGTTQASDRFGTSVAISGDVIVVGAPLEDGGAAFGGGPDESATNSGAAYVFSRAGTTWTQDAYLKPQSFGATQAGDLFGSSVAIDGGTIVVGAPMEDNSNMGVNSPINEAGVNSGAAYVFHSICWVINPVPGVSCSGTSWDFEAYLKPTTTGTMVGDAFGRSVAVSANTIVVGAPGEDSSSTGVNSSANESALDSGAAYVFTFGSQWAQTAYLKPQSVGTTQAGDGLGASIAISGDRIVVGAPLEDGSAQGVNPVRNEGAIDRGAAYVFSRSGGSWMEEAYLKPTAISGSANDQFGFSVGISGDLVVVGMPMEDGNGTGVNSTPTGVALDTGAAFTYVRDPSTSVWSQQSYLKRGTPTTGAGFADNFGRAVAVSGDVVIVGAPFDDTPTTDGGSVYLFNPQKQGVLLSTIPSSLFITSAGAGCAPGTYPSGTTIWWNTGASCTLSVPTTQNGLLFAQWEDLSLNPVRNFTVGTGAVSYLARYGAPARVNVSVSQTGAGEVSGPGVNCATSTPCQVQYALGAFRTLTATGFNGNIFTSWGGACSGTGNCSLLVSQDPTSVVANFSPPSASVRILSSITKSGPSDARIWTFSFINDGPSPVDNLRITGFTITQSQGTGCTLNVLTPIPIDAGPVPPTGVIGKTVPITIVFNGGSACAFPSRFNAGISYSYTFGATTVSGKVWQYNNQIQ